MAANKQNVEGGDLMLFLGEDTIAFATSHKLSINVETIENSSKDNGGGKWVSKTAKRISWNVSSDNLYLEKGDTTLKQKAFGDLYDLMVKREPISVVFTAATEAKDDTADSIPEAGWTKVETGKYEGQVIITSLEANAPNGDNATYSVSMEGVGELKHTPEA